MRHIYSTIRFHLPKKIVHNKIYKTFHSGKSINWKNPSTYDEWIHYFSVKLYDKTYGRYADKYEVRKIIIESGFEDILIPLLGVYKKAEDIDFSALPDDFILKTNNASGTFAYEICNNKNNINKEELIKKFKMALNTDFAYVMCEYQYEKIKPLILCEKLLKQSGYSRLFDYKVVCSLGNPKCILVCSDRDKGRDYYSTNWEYLEYTKIEYRSKNKIKKPEKLDYMLEIAGKLSTDLPLARIDFYEINGKLYFGEITLTPAAGIHQYLTDYGQSELGSFFHK